jgi:hypothetical protein
MCSGIETFPHQTKNAIRTGCLATAYAMLTASKLIEKRSLQNHQAELATQFLY